MEKIFHNSKAVMNLIADCISLAAFIFEINSRRKKYEQIYLQKVKINNHDVT